MTGDSPPSLCDEEADIPVVLPSDPQWRLDIYFKMMEAQKHPTPTPWPEAEKESEAKRPRVSEDTGRSRECRRSIQSAGGVCWSSSDLALAAKLLETPNARFPSITFSNIEEKRRVFTLVYDVLRYKSVLNEALNDVYFFTRYSYLKERCHLVWLLFLDLYKRDFTLREPLDPEVEAAFQGQGLFEIDEILWQLRVKLAATVSRLRIKSGAHSLCSLLPHHLRVTRSALEENIVSGWVNIFKTSLKDASVSLESCGFTPLPRDREVLEPLTYKTDHLLPRFLHIMPNVREDLVESPLLQNHHIVMQERTFCLGPAVIAQLLKDYALSGKVAQTHVNSPITMAYFANLLNNNDKIESLLVFGAGYRKEACEHYLKELGVKNTLVFSENFASLSPESRVLDNVIAVLATPPNTNSSVVDPVDLAVARGGDLQILQQLTDDDFASTPRGDNINKFLRDQRDTLRRGMSKPQIQFIVYETHSRFHCENEEMATNLVNELNNYARDVHLEELRRAQGETQDRERTQTETSETSSEVPPIKVEEELSLPAPSPAQSVQIPPSDLFEIGELPDLCPSLDNCLDLQSEGTYITVIKRKEITRLDPKYMIQMAEARGLFGRPDATPKTKTPGQTARAKAALAALQARSDSFEKNKTKVKVEMDRIAAPTRASMLRDVNAPSSKDCPRFTHHLAHDGTPTYTFPHPARKTFLTPEEEEELIRRLYICPRLNVYPAKLYEDLPNLKFWNSPAPVIECYLQRKVFQKRLQLAYEFNQSKEKHQEILLHDAEEDPHQLTQAVNQLTDDIDYFTYLTQQPTIDLDNNEGSGDRNTNLWNEIQPQEIFVVPEKTISFIDEKELANEFKLKLHDNIRRTISEYKKFYRLQNLRNEEKPPLSETIDKTPHESEESSVEENTSRSQIYRESCLKKKVSITPSKEKIYVVSKENTGCVSEVCSRDYAGKLPQLQSTSEFSLPHNPNLQKLLKRIRSVNDDLDSLLPQLPVDNMYSGFSRRGTMLTLRDSIELAQKRFSSKASKSIPSNDFSSQIPPLLPTANYKDSFEVFAGRLSKVKPMHSGESMFTSSSQTTQTITLDEISSRTMDKNDDNIVTEHHDSFGLTAQRITSKEKTTGDSVNCDICNNDNISKTKSLQFLCSFHASTMTSKHQVCRSIMATQSKTCLGHKDSVEIAKKKASLKDNRKSIACQIDENTIKYTLPQLINGKKRGTKLTKLSEESIKSENIKRKPTKLKSYLMGAVQISKVNALNDSSSK